MTPTISHIKTVVNKLAKTVRSGCKTLFPFSSPTYVLVPSPSLDTPYPAPFHDAGPLFLSAASLATYLKFPPYSCGCPDCISIQPARRAPKQRLDPVLASANPQSGPVVPTVPSYPPSSAVPIKRPGGLRILTEDELNAAIDRMLERLDAQEGQDQERFDLFPVKQPTKPDVTVVQPRPSLSAAEIQRSDDLPDPCGSASEPEEDKLLTALKRISEPNATGDYDDDKRAHDNATTSRRFSSPVQLKGQGDKLGRKASDFGQALLSVVLWEDYGA